MPPCGGHLDGSDEKLDELKFQVVPPCGGHPFLNLLDCRIQISFKSCPRVGGILHPCKLHHCYRCFKSCPRVGGII